MVLGVLGSPGGAMIPGVHPALDTLYHSTATLDPPQPHDPQAQGDSRHPESGLGWSHCPAMPPPQPCSPKACPPHTCGSGIPPNKPLCTPPPTMMSFVGTGHPNPSPQQADADTQELGGVSRQIFMLLRGRGLSFKGLPLCSSGTQRKLPLCSKGTNFGLRFGYSWYSCKTRDVRTHGSDPSCPQPLHHHPLIPLGSLIHSPQGQHIPSLPRCSPTLAVPLRGAASTPLKSAGDGLGAPPPHREEQPQHHPTLPGVALSSFSRDPASRPGTPAGFVGRGDSGEGEGANPPPSFASSWAQFQHQPWPLARGRKKSRGGEG